MPNKLFAALWLFLYILSAALGFIPEPSGIGRLLLILLSLGTFVPGFWLLLRNRKDPALVKRICILSGISLGLTLVLMVINILSVFLSSYWGDFFYYLLGICSAPMLCIQHRWMSLFLWACLLLTGLELLRRNCAPKKQK